MTKEDVNFRQKRGAHKDESTISNDWFLFFSAPGDGPDTQFLMVQPANFHSLESRSKTDWDLMTIITFGAAFSPMHGWADRLTEEERWDVLRYIRLLAPFNPMALSQPSLNG
jgi:hypothetical protein